MEGDTWIIPLNKRIYSPNGHTHIVSERQNLRLGGCCKVSGRVFSKLHSTRKTQHILGCLALKSGDLFLRSRASLVYLFCAILNFKRLRDDGLSRER